MNSTDFNYSDISFFLDKLSRHDAESLKLMREIGGFEFESMPVAPGAAGETWTAHPQEMPAMTALQGLYHCKYYQALSDLIEDPAEHVAYMSKKAETLVFLPAMKEAFEHCVSDYLTSVSNYFADPRKNSIDNEKTLANADWLALEKIIDSETCRDANAAILLTLAVATGNQPVAQKIIKDIPGALDVFLCADMTKPSQFFNGWIRPAAALVQFNTPDMVACFQAVGWDPAQKVAIQFNRASPEGDFARARDLGDKEGASLFSMLVQRIHTDVNTSPMLVDAISQASQEAWRPDGAQWDRETMDKLQYSIDCSLSTGINSSGKNNAYALVVAKHFLACGVLDWELGDFALVAARKGKFDFLKDAAPRLNWDNLRLEQDRFIPSILIKTFFDNGADWCDVIDARKTIDTLCQACIQSGHGQMLVGMELDGKAYRPLNELVTANCPNAVLMALQQGASPNDCCDGGTNAHQLVRQLKRTEIGELISAFEKKSEALSILDELFNNQLAFKP